MNDQVDEHTEVNTDTVEMTLEVTEGKEGLGMIEEDYQQKGLEERFEIKKLTNPDKKVVAIVLEFDDPIARKAIEKYANFMLGANFELVYKDLIKKLKETAPSAS